METDKDGIKTLLLNVHKFQYDIILWLKIAWTFGGFCSSFSRAKNPSAVPEISLKFSPG